MHIYGKTFLAPNPKAEGTFIKYRTYKINGIGTTVLILVGGYGAYKLINYIFSPKKKETKKDETE